MRLRYLMPLALVLFGLMPAPAQALTLYSTGGLGGSTLIDTLFTVNTTTGVATAVGPTGQFLGTGGLAYDPLLDTLLATGGATGTTAIVDSLFSVDRNTGAATLIGSTGVFSMSGLAFDTANNTLYGIGCPAPCGGNTFPDFLYSINTSTGAATQLFNLGAITGATAGLEYVAVTNLLYSIGEVNPTSFYSIDPGTGGVTNLGSPGQLIAGGLAFDSTMYTVGTDQSFIEATYSLNLANGARTLIGASGSGQLLSVGGLAFGPDRNGGNGGAVPEPSSLLLLGSALAGLGLWRKSKTRS